MKKSQMMSTQKSSVIQAFYSFHILYDFNMVKHCGAWSMLKMLVLTATISYQIPQQFWGRQLQKMKNPNLSVKSGMVNWNIHVHHIKILGPCCFFAPCILQALKTTLFLVKLSRGDHDHWPVPKCWQVGLSPLEKGSRHHECRNYANRIKIAVWSFKLWRAEWKKNTTEV